ncbi:hypothetical protein BCR26_17560 [Enterococcus rivorum]|uniref:Replication-associated protein ORF2/G2P domain-containing protein n=1 Tax=Enterococcus rivorum TaxID=762845 RepID=A0A1E5KTB6_9ENTE|nr:hypothetical protein BCR26_17560 [Enterococcus rivorum]
MVSPKENKVDEKERIDRKAKYYKNKAQHIRRLVNMNFDSQTKFLTLTFSDDLEELEKANYLFNKFIKRLNYRLTKKMNLPRTQYIATWEVQAKRRIKTGKAVIHYHVVLFNFPFILADELQAIWKHGFIRINQIPNDVAKAKYGSYVSKYFTKDLAEKSEHKKAFFTSQNLKKPSEKVMSIENIEEIKQELQQSKNLELYKNYPRKIFINEEEYFENETTYIVLKDSTDFDNIIKSSINEKEKKSPNQKHYSLDKNSIA